MDFTILYRFIWQPRKVFQQFVDKTRLEPFVFVVAYAILSYLWYFWGLLKTPHLFLLSLFQGLFTSLIFPVVNAIIAFLMVRFWLGKTISFLSVVSVAILCGVPYFIEGLLMAGFGYHPSTGLSSIIPILGIKQPFLVGALVLVTPFFVWIVFLWWVAVNQLFNLQRRQSILFISGLVLMDLLISGAWRQIKYLLAA